MNDVKQFVSQRSWLVLALPIALAACLAVALPSLTPGGAVDAAPATVLTGGQPADVPAEALAEAQGLSQAFRAVAKHVHPAVVMIQKSAARPVKSNGMMPSPGNPFEGSPFGKRFGDIPELKRFFEQGPRMPDRNQQGMGSGVIVDKSGVILTNNHVVEGGGKIVVRLHDGREFEATEVKTDPKTDLAVVRIEGVDNLQAAALGDSDKMEIGDWVLALGHPFGLEGSVTAGIISAKSRGIGITAREDFLQTDAAINPGNSGGPLVNLRGEVVGINTAISSRSGGNQGIGFAVPINLARWVTDQLISDGSVHRAHLGVVIQPVTPELAKQFGVDVHEGVLVAEVRADSPAAKAGVQPGDVIVEFNDHQVSSPRELQLLVERAKAGETQALVVLRDSKRVTLKVNCEVLAEDEQQASVDPKSHHDKMGLELSDLTPEVARQLGLTGVQGVVITAVEPGSLAAGAGLSSGDVVAEVNRKPVTSVSEFREAVASQDSERGTLLLVKSEKGSRFVVIQSQS